MQFTSKRKFGSVEGHLHGTVLFGARIYESRKTKYVSLNMSDANLPYIIV